LVNLTLQDFVHQQIAQHTVFLVQRRVNLGYQPG
jgi:hypothetical protein